MSSSRATANPGKDNSIKSSERVATATPTITAATTSSNNATPTTSSNIDGAITTKKKKRTYASMIKEEEECTSMRLYILILDYHLYTTLSSPDEDEGDYELYAQETLKAVSQLIYQHPQVISQRISIKNIMNKMRHANVPAQEILTEYSYIHHYDAIFENSSSFRFYSWLPAHLASVLGTTPLLQLFLKKCPEAASQRINDTGDLDRCDSDDEDKDNDCDGGGMIPLHFACAQSNVDCVSLSLSFYKEGVSIQDFNGGTTPLHEATIRGHVECVRLLLQIPSKAASIADRRGRIALHNAAKFKYAELIRLLLDAYQQGANIKDEESGNLPLHDACDRNYFLHNDQVAQECIQAIVDAYPEGIQVQNDKGRLPIHEAAANSNDACFTILLKEFKEGASIKDNNGDLPIQLILNHEEIDNDQFRALVEAYPKSVSIKNDDKSLPLHIFAKYGRDDCLQTCLDAYKKGVVIRDGKERLALHIAITPPKLLDQGSWSRFWNDRKLVSGNYKCMNILLQTDMGADGAKVQDEKGRIPLHYIVHCDEHPLLEQSILTLLDAYKEGIRVKDENDVTPISTMLMKCSGISELESDETDNDTDGEDLGQDFQEEVDQREFAPNYIELVAKMMKKSDYCALFDECVSMDYL